MRARQFAVALRACDSHEDKVALTDYYIENAYILSKAQLSERKMFFLFDDSTGLEMRLIAHNIKCFPIAQSEIERFRKSLTQFENDKLDECLNEVFKVLITAIKEKLS